MLNMYVILEERYYETTSVYILKISHEWGVSTYPVFHVSTDACMRTFHISKKKKPSSLTMVPNMVFTTLDVHYQSTYSILKSSVIVGVEVKHHTIVCAKCIANFSLR